MLATGFVTMTVFGTVNLTLNGIHYFHAGTLSDSIVNNVFAFVAIICIIIGLVCNVAVFYYNHCINSGGVASIIYR